MDRLYKIGYGTLVGFVILLALLVLVSLFPIKGNYQIKIVQSGSMEPAIKTGSIVVIKPEDNYVKGNVITFGEDTQKTAPTTHRIVESRVVSGKLLFTTKGDANENSDFTEVPAEKIIGKVLFDIPYFGYVIDFAKKPLGFALIIGVPAAAIIFDELGKIWAEIRKLRKKRSEEDSNANENI